MSFQLKHTKLGYFQGFIEDMTIWYPASCVYELRVYPFKDSEDAEHCMDMLNEILGDYEGTIEVEVYDPSINNTIAAQGIAILQSLSVYELAGGAWLGFIN